MEAETKTMRQIIYSWLEADAPGGLGGRSLPQETGYVSAI